MAYIEQRKKGWLAQVRRKGMPTASRTFDTKSDAQAWAAEIERELRRGNIGVLRQDAQRITIREVLERYRAGVLPTSRDIGLPFMLKAVERRFGAYFVGNVAAIDVARWRDDLTAERYAPKTVGHHLRALSALLNFAQRELSIQLPAGNPVAGVRKPREGQPRERRFKPGEREALLAQCQNLDQTAVVELAVETSMRRSELIGLRWEHVDLQRRTAHLPRTKNGSARTVALSSAAVAALAALPRRIDGRVFRWATPGGFGAVWQALVKRARKAHILGRLREALTAEGVDADAEIRALVYKKRLPSQRTVALLEKIEKADPFLRDLHFHDLRHEATSRLFEKGLGIMEVASMTGHKSLAMLKRYTHVEAERLAVKLG